MPSVTANQELFSRQSRTVHADLGRALAGLAEIRQRLEDRACGRLITGGRAPATGAVRRQCDGLLGRPFLAGLIPARGGPEPSLEYRVDGRRIEEWSDTVLGKTTIITLRLEWGAEEIVEAYPRQFIKCRASWGLLRAVSSMGQARGPPAAGPSVASSPAAGYL